jgi:hypothetical protein
VKIYALARPLEKIKQKEKENQNHNNKKRPKLGFLTKAFK